MAFIDIFNFKKYFSKPSDSQVARYGHVNALYDALSANIATKANYFLPTAEGDITITTKAGVVTIEESLQDISTLNFNLVTADVTVDTVLLVTVTNNNGFVLGLTYSITSGEANITISNRSGFEATDLKVHFLII